MTQNSMFFSNGSWYTQDMFARFLKDIFGHDGVADNIGNELAVSANSPANMAVSVATGRSYVQGYIHEILTDAVQLAISDADPTNPRIDRIVLRLDVNTNRNITVAVLAGTPAASPVAPTLTQTSTIWEVSLAQVRVDANATVINSGNITDERQYMWMNRDNMPKASTTEYGVVKVGSGIIVNNGVLSVDGTKLRVTTASRTNSGGFAVGTASYSVPAQSGSVSASGWTDVIPAFHLTNPVNTTYNAFIVAEDAYKEALPPFTFTGSQYIDTAASLSYNARAIRVSTGEVMASISGNNGYSTTGTVYIPSDWDFNTDTIKFQGFATYSSKMSITVTASTPTGTVYYRPTTEE